MIVVHYKFAVSTKGSVFLVCDGKAICPIDDMAGYEHVRIKIVDSIVDNLDKNMSDIKTEDTNNIQVGKNITKNNSAIYLFLYSTIISVLFIIWMMGVVLAKGFWLTLLSCVMPLYSFYLVTERLMSLCGMIS